MVDTLHRRFILFSGSAMLVGFKIGDQVFDDLVLELVVGVCSSYGKSV